MRYLVHDGGRRRAGRRSGRMRRRKKRTHVEAQHVEDADVGDRSAVKLGRLVDACTDEEPAVGPAVDGDLALGGDLLRDEVLGRPLEVVKHVLLALFRAGLVPTLAILGTAADVGDGEDGLVVLDPGQDGPARERDGVSAVARRRGLEGLLDRVCVSQGRRERRGRRDKGDGRVGEGERVEGEDERKQEERRDARREEGRQTD